MYFRFETRGMNFPDLPHLEHLRSDLWQWPRSRAAVMVGSGFSRNAEPIPGANKEFPTWRQLAQAMFDQLNPARREDTPDRELRRKARFNAASPLRVASEYEAAFDEGRLESLLREQIPDGLHTPGALHHLLLQLPWADVFTTNYDTLLERTEAPGRTYNPVTKPGDLTTAFAPRIIKLHGSFPSQAPFIATEEHYRTYPRKFAPFVNCVRQSLLENSLVLVGFSGDDPNFLEWTGWIRDELGGKHAPIYFVGPLSLTPPQRSLLQRRGITPIDLSPVFQEVNTDKLHEASIEWFLESLRIARKPRPEEWPDTGNRKPPGNNRVPPLPDVDETAPAVTMNPPRTLTHEDVRKALTRWQFERQRYPGWIVAPQEVRSSLWDKTKFWVFPLIEFAKGWPAADRAVVFREINWRFETTMAPLFSELAQSFEAALDELYEASEQGQRPFPLSGFTNDASEVADAWCEVALALLRDAREDYDADRWNRMAIKVDRVISHRVSYSDRSRYEVALWALWNVDIRRAKNALAIWQPSSRSPLAQLRKAALLAELDEPGEAIVIAKSALLEITRALRTQGQNIELLSLEGWGSYLLRGIELALNFLTYPETPPDMLRRWQELKAFDCDPWSHIRYFDEILSAVPPDQRTESLTRGFDPGEFTVSRKLGSDNIGPLLPAFACVRLFEQAGVAIRLRGVTPSAMLGNACRWIAPHAGFWSPALLIRAGRLDDLLKEDSLSRTRIAVMQPAFARRIYHWCFQILEREAASARGPINMGSGLESILQSLAQVLSRLAFHIGAADLGRAFGLACNLYKASVAQFQLNLIQASDKWFERLFWAADRDALLEWLPSLIRLPLFSDTDLGPHAERAWPDPMRNFPGGRFKANQTNTQAITEITKATGWLLARAESESGEGRRRAIERLTKLFPTKLMKVEQERQLGVLLWSQRNSAGLPDPPGLVSNLLHLPAPESVDVRSIVKSYILGLPATGAVSRDANGAVTISIGGSAQPLLLEASRSSKPIIGSEEDQKTLIEWTAAESRQLYDNARDWWANDKVALSKPQSLFMGFDSAKETAKGLGLFMARVVLQRTDWLGEPDWAGLLTWLQELREYGIFPTVALPYIMASQRVEPEVVAEAIATDISSDLDDAVSAAALTIRHWAALSAAGLVPALPPALAMGLIERVVFRQKPAIAACIAHLAYLIRDYPRVIASGQASLVAASLAPWYQATMLTDFSGEFDEAERPELRAKVGSLAAALEAWFLKCAPHDPTPSEITQWREWCKSARLPEIRQVFEDWFSPESRPTEAGAGNGEMPKTS